MCCIASERSCVDHLFGGQRIESREQRAESREQRAEIFGAAMLDVLLRIEDNLHT
jgi:hypothetical protein